MEIGSYMTCFNSRMDVREEKNIWEDRRWETGSTGGREGGRKETEMTIGGMGR
jgi:hypothetical protein